ncbi:teichoic acid biosynthesis protein C [Streptosporangium sp. NPDC006013]|uniref:phage baseplate protein n=1 Tax=Streptosporangium sp. NPDC006013 TaxID=3155596 RepID=UPI0033AE6C8B
MPYLSRAITRRGLFTTATGAAAATALGGFAGVRSATAEAAGDRFDLTAPATGLIWKKALYDETVLQSFAFDNANGHIYVAQLKNGAGSAAAGNLCVTKLSLGGTVLGHMYLMGFGHGVQIGVEPSGTTAYLWTETNGVNDGANAWGNRLARFKFVNGQTLTASSSALTKYAPIAGATSTTCAIDPSTNRLIMRYRAGGTARFAVYSLAALKSGTATPLFDIAQPSGLGVFQGYTVYGRYLYLLDGTAYSGSNPAPGNTYITCVDLRTGGKVQRSLSQAGKSLDFREPEGMAIQIAGGEPRLCLGLASGVAGARKASIFYKTALV